MISIDWAQVGFRIRKAMEHNGYTCKQVADRCGRKEISRSTVQRLRAGSVDNPGIVTVLEVCRALDIPLTTLLKGTLKGNASTGDSTNKKQMGSVISEEYTGLPHAVIEMMHAHFGGETPYRENFLGEFFDDSGFFIEMNFCLQRIAQLATMLHIQNQEIAKKIDEGIWGNVHMIQKDLERLLDSFIDAYVHGEGYKSPRYMKECAQRISEEGSNGNNPQENK